MASTHKVYEGRSKTSFEEAAQDAIKKLQDQEFGQRKSFESYLGSLDVE